MAGLWIKCNCYNVPLLWDICSHLPVFLANRINPVDFAGFVIFRNTCNEILKTVLATYLFGRGDNHNTVSNTNIHFVTNSKLRIREQALCKAKPLAIAPFLNFGMHLATSLLCISEV